MAEKIVTLGRYGTLVDAERVRAILEDEGIPAFVADGATGTMMGVGVGGVTPSVLVAEDDVQRARAALDALGAAERATPEEVEEALRAAGAYDGQPLEESDKDAEEREPTEDVAIDPGGETWARRLRLMAVAGFLIGLFALGALLWSLQPPQKVVLSPRALSVRFQARALAWSALGVHVLVTILLRLRAVP